MTLSKGVAKIIIKALESWASGIIPPNPHFGICFNLDNLINPCGYKIVENNSTDWEHYSGNISYPIVRINEDYDNDMWGDYMWGDSTYANMRRNLCSHIASKLRIEYNIPK